MIVRNWIDVNFIESNQLNLIRILFFYDEERRMNNDTNFAIIKHFHIITPLFYTPNISYNFDLWNCIRNINHFMNDLHIYVWVMVTEFSSGPLSGVSQIFLQGCRHFDCLVQENVFSRLKGKDEVDWEWRIRTCLRMRKA